MEEETNIFLRILKIGADLQGEPISFNELNEMLKKEFTVPKKMVPPIRRWFYDYYYLPETFRMNKGMINTLSDYDLKKSDDNKADFTGDGFFKYYEYLEVKKAYDNAQIAILNAEKSTALALESLFWVRISIACTLAVGVVQILLMVFV